MASRYWSGSERERIWGGWRKACSLHAQKTNSSFQKNWNEVWGTHVISDWRTAKNLDFSPDVQKDSSFSWSGLSSVLTALIMNKPDCPYYHLKFYNKYFTALASTLRTAEFSPLQSPRKSEYVNPLLIYFLLTYTIFLKLLTWNMKYKDVLSENSTRTYGFRKVYYNPFAVMPYCVLILNSLCSYI